MRKLHRRISEQLQAVNPGDALNYPAVAHQLDQLTRSLYENGGENITGVYLHGSLAMGCFQPGRSDLDLLVLLTHQPAPGQQRFWGELLLDLSGAPAPIEISFLHRDQYTPWQYPTPYDFHFSEAWRTRLVTQLKEDGTGGGWDNMQGLDVDLAAHFTVARSRGLCIAGEGIATALPAVPWGDYMDAITRDIVWACAGAADNPVYLVLNCCRVWAAAADRRVLSKVEGALWALPRLPQPPGRTVATALAIYSGAVEKGHEALTTGEALAVAQWTCAQMGVSLPADPAAGEVSGGSCKGQ